MIDPRSPDAEACAERAFAAADAEAASTQIEFRVLPWGYYPGPVQYPSIPEIVAHIRESSRLAQRAALAYESALRWTRPRWTIRALIGQARVYERVARTIVDGSRTGRAEFDDRVRQAMEPQIVPVECLAVVRYLLAVRAARAAGIDLAEVTQAMEQLHRHGADRIAQCADDQRRRDSTFTPFTPRDLDPLP